MVNKLLIITLVSIFILSSVIADFQKVYILGLKYNNGIITKESIIVTQAFYKEEKNQQQDGYLLELISFDNKTLYRQYFNFQLEVVSEPPAEWFDERGNQIYIPNISSNLTLEESMLQLVIPYFRDGKKINIFDPKEKKVLEIEVGYFANVCGDRICQEHESYLDCPKDCPSGSKDDFCDKKLDSICDPDCISGDPDCKLKQERNIPWSIIIISGLILIIIIFYIFYRKR